MVEKQILETSKDFKQFWKKKGPYRYALTCNEFPPVLLEPEQWLFSDDVVALLKALMQFDVRKMKFVKAPFNPDNKTILRPEMLSPWKINNFPEEWNICVSEYFIPEGHLTQAVMDQIRGAEGKNDAARIEQVFFQCLEQEIESFGYLLFRCDGVLKNEAIRTYLDEWEKDDQEAGF